MPLKRRAAPRAETMIWDGSAWQKALAESATYPNLRVIPYCSGTALASSGWATDAVGGQNVVMKVAALNRAFSGSQWNRWRNNTEATVLPSATRTASGNSADQTNYNAKGVILYIDVTAVSGTSPTLDVYITVKDPITGKYKGAAKSVTISSADEYFLICYPGATRKYDATLDEVWDIPVPRTWRVHYAIGGTNPSFTFSIGAMYIV